MITTVEAGRIDPIAHLQNIVDAAARVEADGRGQIHVSVPVERLVETCATVHGLLAAPLTTMVGVDDRARTGLFQLAYVFSTGGHWVSVETGIDPARPRFPSVTPCLPAAHWYEREVQDLLGLIPEGHPDPRRLVLHDDWPEGIYPLRKDFDPTIPVPRVDGPKHRFHHLHGEGFVEIPVGPIHAGVIEPGHFRFAAIGEVVLHLETRLFYTHRGIEKLAEGKSHDQGLQIAERVCGACAFSHAVSYCQAIETIAAVAVPPRALALRTLFLELERLYNHVGDLGNICAGVGFAVGTSQGSRLKEELQRLNERLTGHRFLRGVCRVGGVRRDLDTAGARDASETLRRVEAEFRRFAELILSTDALLDRMTGTGIVPTRAAHDLGAVGVAARASGIDRDARRDHPHACYDQLDLHVPVRTEGDVRARARVRVDEAHVSFSLARQVLAGLPSGTSSVSVQTLPPYATALGVTESPRGENVHWVRTGPEGKIDRYRVRSASFCNWPIVALAVPGNMVPDFPLINKSFELCYACLDR
ncbi:MAG: NADH-quinone oxidoreductase subunit F [Chloroflexota bacterium]|nr:MAG: NADH-quinone oxidoreductase subunit F [Chloroflexota bacterium]